MKIFGSILFLLFIGVVVVLRISKSVNTFTEKKTAKSTLEIPEISYHLEFDKNLIIAEAEVQDDITAFDKMNLNANFYRKVRMDPFLDNISVDTLFLEFTFLNELGAIIDQEKTTMIKQDTSWVFIPSAQGHSPE